MSVTLFDDLFIQKESIVYTIDVCKRPPIFIFPLYVIFKNHIPSFNFSLRKS